MAAWRLRPCAYFNKDEKTLLWESGSGWDLGSAAPACRMVCQVAFCAALFAIENLMNLKTSGEWPLASGTWRAADGGWALLRTAAGNTGSPLLSLADVGRLMHARRLPGAPGRDG